MTATLNVMDVRAAIEHVDTGLEEKYRKDLAGHLRLVLADTVLLMIKSQVVHWNVVGPLFVPLHELTEEHYKDLFKAADEIAERIRALGFPAPVNFEKLSDKSSLYEEESLKTAQVMIEQLTNDHERVTRAIRDSAKFAEEQNDFVTHDLLTERLAFHEKAVWMLRAIVANGG